MNTIDEFSKPGEKILALSDVLEDIPYKAMTQWEYDFIENFAIAIEELQEVVHDKTLFPEYTSVEVAKIEELWEKFREYC